MPVPCTPPYIIPSICVRELQEDEIYMARFLHHGSSGSLHPIRGLILAVFWISGLTGGILTGLMSGTFLTSMMRSTLAGAVSIVSLMSTALLPFLLSAFAVFFSCRWLVYPIALLRAFLYGFSGQGITACFGSAGWLFRLLLCFTQLCCAPVFYWYCMQCLRPCGEGHGLRTVSVLCLVLLIGSIDYCLISPLFRDLIIF